MNVDAEVETNGPALNESEIVAEILGEGGDQNDGDDEEEFNKVDDDTLLPPTTYSVENAIETLSKFSLFCEDGKFQQSANDLFMQVNAMILKNKEQKTIEHFYIILYTIYHKLLYWNFRFFLSFKFAQHLQIFLKL